MKAKKLIAGTFVSKVITVVSLVFFSLSGSAVAGEDKVKVCHFPGGDKTKGKVITVSKNSLNSHLEHGDTTRFSFTGQITGDTYRGSCREIAVAPAPIKSPYTSPYQSPYTSPYQSPYIQR